MRKQVPKKINQFCGLRRKRRRSSSGGGGGSGSTGRTGSIANR
eukprot:COSAG02_NODE_19966_length_855_cov_1.120370_2_plen_42_part_01